MSFDVNPMGPQMHLKQLEREVKSQQIFENAAPATETKIRHESEGYRNWIARIADMFATPRTAS